MHALVITTNGASRTFLLDSSGPWRIGRKTPCEIVINDKFVSAYHAQLSLAPDGLLLQRIKAFNPVRVGEKEVESAVVQTGGRFTIGKTSFLIMDSNAAETNSELSLLDSREILAKSKDSSLRMGSAQLMKEISRIAESCEEDELNRLILNLTCGHLGAQRAFLALAAGDAPLKVVAKHGFEEDISIQSLVSTTVLNKVVQDLQTVLIANVSEHLSIRAQDSIQKNNIRAVACAPFLNPDMSVAGVIYIDNQIRESQFEPRDAEFLLWAGHFYKLLSEMLRLRKRMEIQVDELKRAAAGDVRMIAESKPILEVLERARKIAKKDDSVLILGESGTGKECIAQFIHRQSPRARGPFVALNCAAISETLFESEMFGHVEGAYSGAKSARKGAFQQAAGGTLFLDEIGLMDYSLQAKLLRAIEEKKVRPVGAEGDVSVDVHIICATNSDLRAAINAKEFREDLYFRLSTFSVEIPPLRKRREDIVPLGRYFTRIESNGGRTLTEEAEAHLTAHDWRGNVRELRAVIKNAVCMSAGNAIQSTDLELPNLPGRAITLPGAKELKTLNDVEREHIAQAMRQLNGNITHTAVALKIARSTLVAKLKDYGLYQ